MNKDFLQQVVGDEAVIDAILQEHNRVVADLNYQHTLADAVRSAGGRSLAAIRALLDEQAIRQQEDVASAVAEALGQLKKDSGYLFEPETVRQPYAAGQPAQLRRKPTMEDVGKMSMAEYRAYRMGRGKDGN